MKSFLLILALTCLLLATSPASASISVRVRHWNGSCVAGAEVIVRKGEREIDRMTTNDRGYACVTMSDYGDFTLDCAGYESKPVHSLRPGRNRHVEFVTVRVNGGRLPQVEWGGGA